jgi:hypothetical protein
MPEQVEDRRAPERVLDADDAPGRLVHQDVDRALLLAPDRPPVDGDLVAGRIDLLPQLHDGPAVDADAPVGDPPVGLPPRAHPGVGEELVEPHHHWNSTHYLACPDPSQGTR